MTMTITQACGHKRRVTLKSAGAVRKSAEAFDLAMQDCPRCVADQADELAPRRQETEDRQTITTPDAKTRSLELALARGQTACSHAARTLGWALDARGALVSLALEVRSATNHDTLYAVGYLAATDDATCECAAAQHGQRGCWHRGLAILCGRDVARLYTPQGRAESERTYQRDLAHEGNAAALDYAGATSRVCEEF